MTPLLRLLMSLPFVVYYILEGILLSLIPKSLRYKDVSGETVLITGGGSGIGKQLALEFANRGSRLVLLDINRKGLKETQDLIAKKSFKNVDVFLYECDVSNRDMVYSVAAKIKNEVGTITILVNNAGILSGKRFLDCPDTIIQKTMDVNIMSHFWTCKAFLPDMKAANHGHVVSVASLSGFIPSPLFTDYCASKHAAVGFEESLRFELEQEGFTGIKTTLIAPYFVQTGLIEGIGARHMAFSIMSPEWVAKQIISSVLTDEEVLIIPGLHYYAVLLKTLLPRKAFRRLFETLGITDGMEQLQRGKKMA